MTVRPRLDPAISCLLAAALFGSAGFASDDDATAAAATTATPATPVAVDAGLLNQPAAARAKAVAALTTAAIVHLPVGTVTLAEAIAALVKSGNATALTAACDGTAKAALAGGDMTYWQAVMAVSAAWNLEPVAGEPRVGSGGGRLSGEDQHPLAVQTGTLQLNPGRPGGVLIWAADGPLVGIVDDCTVREERGAHTTHRVDLAVALRVEPRLEAARIGFVTATTPQADIDGTAAPVADSATANGSDLDDDQNTNDHLHLHLDLARDPAVLRLRSHVQLTLIQSWTAKVDIVPGGQVDVHAGAADMRLHLVDANSRGLNGAKGPLLELLLPHAGLFGEPRLSLMYDGKILPARNTGVSTTEQGRVVANIYASLGPGSYAAAIDGAGHLDDVGFDPDLRFDLTALAGAAADESNGMDAFAATQVTWPAQHATLATAVKLLSQPGRRAPAGIPGASASAAAPADATAAATDPATASASGATPAPSSADQDGNQVLLQFGADESTARDLPAFSGTFWDAVLLVCSTYGVTIAPPTAPMIGNQSDGNNGTAYLAGGPLSLARAGDNAHATQWQASGPLLIEIAGVTATSTRGLNGGGNGATAIMHVRLEPHLDPAIIGACSFTVDTFASDEHGRAVMISGSDAPAETRQPQWIRRRFGGRIVVQEAEPEQPRYDLELTADNLAADSHHLRFSGQLSIEVHRGRKAEADLVPGVAAVLNLGKQPVVATLYDQSLIGGMGIIQPAIGFSGAGAGNLVPTSIEVTSPKGDVLTPNGNGNWARNGRQEMLIFYDLSLPGAYHIAITTVEHQGEVHLPLTVDLPLP